MYLCVCSFFNSTRSWNMYCLSLKNGNASTCPCFCAPGLGIKLHRPDEEDRLRHCWLLLSKTPAGFPRTCLNNNILAACLILVFSVGDHWTGLPQSAGDDRLRGREERRVERKDDEQLRHFNHFLVYLSYNNPTKSFWDFPGLFAHIQENEPCDTLKK